VGQLISVENYAVCVMKQFQKHKNVDAYIASQPVAVQAMLKQIRSIIRSVVPDAEEVASYQVACYKYRGMLVGFGVHRGGCSFYTMNNTLLSSYKKDLEGLKYSGSTIHFTPQQSLPVALIKKLIKLRKKENEIRSVASRKQKKSNTGNTTV
jgi:uncharacterized protein YdhG (YjbR/CyaY superfamily)